MEKKYAHLVKRLSVKEGPKGLYPDKLIWMEGTEMEGFNAHFCYTLINRPCTVHPIDGIVVHPYDECLVIAGTYLEDILKLGAEVAIRLGEEGEEYVIRHPSVILVPKGTPHGPIEVRMLERPIAHYTIGLAPKYSAELIQTKTMVQPPTGKYLRYIKPLRTTVPRDGQGSGMGYEQVVDERGVMRPAERGVGPGNADQLVWLFGKDLEGFEVNFTWGFYSRCGKWHRGGEVHVHPEEEILVFVGLYPDNLNYLGAELELAMGKEKERYVFNTPTVAICPRGFPHLPLITRWVDKPYAFFVICLSGEHESPWVEYVEE